MSRRRGAILGVALTALAAAFPATAEAAPTEGGRPEAERPSLVLLTLDTTRADHLGCYGSAAAETPVLDALAARGTLFRRALTPSPLTLPAHASLLTGLEPPEHGLRDNGTAALGTATPTLATVLSAAGYATGAFVASRVLDRRFGLDAGFDRYDDRMTAERTGEYGYPERDAAAVSSAALDWLAGLEPGRPFFLWAHYYDPHAPYEPPAPWGAGSPERGYAGEIAYMDREIGRLLAGLPDAGRRVLVAAVGDHGEALGEHGERRHGIFLYRASLDVPLILAGPGVPRRRVVEETVGIRRLPATLLELLGLGAGGRLPGPNLPGLAASRPAPEPVYSETWMPANAYGWSPLKALTDQRWRLIVAPRPELYDLEEDPGEEHNLLTEERRQAVRLKRALEERERSFAARAVGAAEVDPELARQLRSLGYLSGGGGGAAAGSIDPKDGIGMLAELEEAKELLLGGRPAPAAAILRELVRRNPGNIPFLTQLGAAELALGNAEAALAAYREAIGRSPRLDFLHLNLAQAYLQLGRLAEARRELEVTLEINPRAAGAWLGLGELAHRAGERERERRLLLEAVAAGTASAAISARLGQLELAAGELEKAEAHLEVATELAPELALVWLLWGDAAAARGRPEAAIERYRRAAELEPESAAILLRLGRLELETGAETEARRHLERAVALAPGTPEAQAARRLLADL